MFDDKWSICEFCRERNIRIPCIKKRRSTSDSLRPVWALPTPDDAIIKPEDGILFEYIYSDDFFDEYSVWVVVRLLRLFRAGYGGTIPSLSLRHAILAFAAYVIPSAAACESTVIEHKSKAFRALISKTAQSIDDADLFATCLLSSISMESDDEDATHIQGMLSILNILYSSTRRSMAQDIFACFRPIFVYAVLPANILTVDSIIKRIQLYRGVSFTLPTFDERLRPELETLAIIPDWRWHVGSNDDAHFYVLRNDIIEMIYGLVLVHEREYKQSTAGDVYLQLMIAKWKADIEHPDCCRLLSISERLLQTNASKEDDDRIKILCIANLTTLFLFRLCSGTTISQALCTSETISIAMNLLSLIRIMGDMINFSYRDKCYLRWFLRQCLFLGSLALTQSEGLESSKSAWSYSS